jgi:CRP-like cAMP-binding protein
VSPVDNLLMEQLPPRDRHALLAHCESVELALAQSLNEQGSTQQRIVFPGSSFISVLARVDEHSALEVAMIGSEGMVGAELALGLTNAPLHTQVQGAGIAWQIEASAFRSELSRSKPLQQMLGRYLYVQMRELASSATCLHFHLIGPRLARWLLMTQDRAHANRFHVTHEHIAAMLGVRRVGITMAASALQRNGVIAYRRGEVTVLDRPALEAAACSCYATNRRVYAEVMG